jgi:hypothetical protein
MLLDRPQSYVTRERAKALLEKWGPMLDHKSNKLRAIEDDRMRITTAQVMENQERHCLEEANLAQTGNVFGTHQGGQRGGAMTPAGDFYASGDTRLPKILIPMIRRTFPELITNEIVGVQPMAGPVGLAFALRYKYESDALGSDANGQDGSSSLNGANVSPSVASDGREIGYNYLDTRFTGASSASLSGLPGVFDFAAEDGGVAKLLSEFELTGNIPQITISFEKTAVEAGTRRLAAKWSVELEQDLKNMNGIDIDTELTNTMSYEIQAEIDREMIMRMVQVSLNAGFPRGYSVWSPASADGRWIAERNRDLYAKIIVEANRIAVRNRRGAANFLVATPRVCAILEMLPEFQWMQVQGSVNTQPVGVARVGNLGGRFNVYRDTRTEAQWGGVGMGQKNPTSTPNLRNNVGAGAPERVEYILLGYKGPEFFDTGIIYAPYIPIMIQRTVAPNDFGQRVGLMTRYGVVDNIFGADLYYHVIIIKNLGQAFTPGTQSVYF